MYTILIGIIIDRHKLGETALIKLANVSKVFSRNGKETKALNNVSVQINKGDIFGVIGLSGAGKSTLIRAVNYLEKPTEGQVFIEDNDLSAFSMKDLRNKRKNIGMIFQHFNLLNSKTIFQNIALPLVLAKVDKETIKQRVTELLEFVGLTDKTNNFPNELSGGQKQRIGIARALATNPSILLCDEATSALDPQTTDSVLELLQKINETYNITIMMITHDMSIIKKICNRVAVMEDGGIIEEGNVIDVFKNPQEPSTKSFVSTVMQADMPQNIYEIIEPLSNSRLLKLYLIDATSSGIVNDLIKQCNVTVNIVYATMDQIKTERVGFIVLQLIGERENIADALAFIRQENILAKELEYHV